MKKQRTITLLAAALLLSWAIAVVRIVTDLKTPEIAANIDLYDLQFNYIFTYLFL